MEPLSLSLATPLVDDEEIVDGYHENLLIVGATPAAARFAEAPAFHTLSVDEGEAPGLRMLSVLEQSGGVRQVYSLAPGVLMGEAAAASAVAGGHVGVVGRITAHADEHAESRLAGASILELRSETDVPRVAEALAEDPQIEFVARVPVRYLVEDEGAVAAAQPPEGLLWNLSRIGWPAARGKKGFVDAGAIQVAVLDTGIDADHPDLAPAVESYTHRYHHPITPVHLSPEDIVGHGTHVAGTIAAGIANGIGIHGICTTRFHAFKIFNDSVKLHRSQGRFVRFVNPIAYRLALRACYERGVDVVNLSIGGPQPPDPVEASLFDDLLTRGTVVVAAMGNERAAGSPTGYPAAIPGIIAVGATRPDDRIAEFSSAGAHISLSAPGTGIWSTLPTYPGNYGYVAMPAPGDKFTLGSPIPRDTGYGTMNGTSMAAPHVAGACALLLAKGPMTPDSVRQRLMATAARRSWMTGPGDIDYGAGRLDLDAAL